MVPPPTWCARAPSSSFLSFRRWRRRCSWELSVYLGSSWCCSGSRIPSSEVVAAKVRFGVLDRRLRLDPVAWASERPSRRRSRIVCFGLLPRRGGLFQTLRRRRIPLAGGVCAALCRSYGAARLGLLVLAGEAVVAAKMEDFVQGLFPRFVGAGSGADEELCGSLFRSGSSPASLWLAGEGGDEDGFGGACCLTGVLVHEDRSFEDFPSLIIPSADPRSGRLRKERWRRRGGAPSAHGGVVVGRRPRDPNVIYLFCGVLCITAHL